MRRWHTSPTLSRIRSFSEQSMLIGYMRVSKADGIQTLDLQRDALLAVGVEPGNLYEDQASGKRDNRPGLEACLKALQQGAKLDNSALLIPEGAVDPELAQALLLIES